MSESPKPHIVKSAEFGRRIKDEILRKIVVLGSKWARGFRLSRPCVFDDREHVLIEH